MRRSEATKKEVPGVLLQMENFVLQMLRELANEMQDWLAGKPQTDGVARIQPNPQDEGAGNEYEFLKDVRNAALEIELLIIAREWKEADERILLLPEVGQRMLYNRVGIILNTYLRDEHTERRMPNTEGEQNQKRADEVIYFG